MQAVSSTATFAIIMGCLLAVVVPAAAQDFQVSGQVKDKQNKGIPKINVMLRRGIVNIATAETDANGSYNVKYPSGGAVTILFNGNTEWHPLLIKNVVGATNNINIQLVSRTEKLTLAEARRTMEALDYLREVPELAGERLEYAKLIDPSLLPPEFQQKFFQDSVLARVTAAEERLSLTVANTEQIEANAQRLSSQLEEFAAVSNAARGGAKAAQSTADAAVAGVTATNERITAIDEYEARPDLSVSVEFPGSSVNLTAQATKILDQLASKIVATKGYTLTIAGFADGTQDNKESIRISQLRAEAVARYLTANYEVPLWRVRAILGYGPSQTVGGKKPVGPANRVDVTTLVNRGLSTPAPTMNPGLDH